MSTPTLTQGKVLERYDLQEWISNSPADFCAELGQKLLILGKEVPPSAAVADRIDLLAVDQNGALVILELKRDSHRLQLLQAVAYAGMVAKWSDGEFDQRFESCRLSIADFVESDEGIINQVQRIILIAEEFDYEVLVAAEWLYDKYEVDISCVRVTMALDQSTSAEYLAFTQIFPAPELDDLAKKRAHRSAGLASAPALTSWDDALAPVGNPAVLEFFERHLASGTSSNLSIERFRFQ